MYHPTTRVLTVLELLQSYPQMSGVELAARLEVDVRTIRRYVVMLQELGIPVEAERGRHGAYHLRPGFKLPPLMFTEDEALGLTLGLIITRRLGLSVASTAVEGALAKVERVMPHTLKERVQAVQDALVVDLAEPAATPDNRIIVALSTAIQNRQAVYMVYRSWRGEESERKYDPYGLVYRSGYWYTAGYCHLREAVRTFRLDRVVSVGLCDDRFTPPAEFDALEQVNYALATTPGTYEIEVLLQTTLEKARQQISPALGTLEPTPEGLILRCYVQELCWFAHFLAGLDFPMVVRQPAELRDTLRQLAEKINRLAELADGISASD